MKRRSLIFKHQGPMLIGATQLKNWDVQEKRTCPVAGEYWVPARPLSMTGIKTRIMLAWKVFTGECDALTWRS
jgi:hypothetical protein